MQTRMLASLCAATLGGLAIVVLAAFGNAGGQPTTVQLSSDGRWTAFSFKGQMLSDDAIVRVTSVACKKQGSGEPFPGVILGLFRRSGSTTCSGAETAGELPPQATTIPADAAGLEYKPHLSDLCASSKGVKFTCQLSGVAIY